MAHSVSRILAAASAAGIASAASAAIFDPAMYPSADPAGFGNLLAELDLADTSYDFPFDSGLFDGSGFISETNGFEFDRTDLVSRVFEVTSSQSLTMGGDSLDLNVGDLVFSYEIRLVGDFTDTIKSLAEFQVGEFGGPEPMDADSIKGRGFVNSGVNGPLGGNPGDLTTFPGVIEGGSHDWQWDNDPANQLQNDETITLLLFTEPTLIGEGTAALKAAGGGPTDQDPNAGGAPVLIPVIPAPGGAIAFAMAGLIGARRRR